MSPVTWALDAADTRHLLGRVAFGVQPGDMQRFATLNRDQAIDLLLMESAQFEPGDFPSFAARPWELDFWQQSPKNPNYRQQRSLDWAELHRWYFDRVLRTRTPLRERMVLFWHAHYANADIDVTQQMVWQNQTFREQALGNYVDLLRSFSRDDANIRNLNLFRNRRDQVNENFGRELLELYSLGIGHYSQADIREASRAFTGWRTWRRTGFFLKWWPWHDFGQKTVLGHTGWLDGDDVIDILAENPRFAEFLVEKLWREFVSPQPDPVEVKRLANRFRHDYRIDGLMRDLLLSPAFWAPKNRLILVKSPVELVVGTLRAIGVPGNDPRSLGPAPGVWCTAMGQKMFLAPDVKGWRGHTDWLNVTTLQVRYQFLQGVTTGFDPAVLEGVAKLSDLGNMNAMYLVGDFQRDTQVLWMNIERLAVEGSNMSSMPQSQDLLDMTYQLR